MDSQSSKASNLKSQIAKELGHTLQQLGENFTYVELPYVIAQTKRFFPAHQSFNDVKNLKTIVFCHAKDSPSTNFNVFFDYGDRIEKADAKMAAKAMVYINPKAQSEKGANFLHTSLLIFTKNAVFKKELASAKEHLLDIINYEAMEPFKEILEKMFLKSITSSEYEVDYIKEASGINVATESKNLEALLALSLFAYDNRDRGDYIVAISSEIHVPAYTLPTPVKLHLYKENKDTLMVQGNSGSQPFFLLSVVSKVNPDKTLIIAFEKMNVRKFINDNARYMSRQEDWDSIEKIEAAAQGSISQFLVEQTQSIKEIAKNPAYAKMYTMDDLPHLMDFWEDFQSAMNRGNFENLQDFAENAFITNEKIMLEHAIIDSSELAQEFDSAKESNLKTNKI